MNLRVFAFTVLFSLPSYGADEGLAKPVEQKMDSLPTPDFIMCPRPLDSWSFRSMIGATLTFVPRPIAEEEIRQIPALDLRARFGLPLGISITTSATTNYLTTTASLGAQLSLNLAGVYVSIGDRQSVWYGVATLDGFDVDALGWMNAPTAAIGVSFGEVHTSLSAEVLFLLSRTTRAGTVEVSSDKRRILGASAALSVEQPFVHRSHLLLALKVNWMTNAYQSWLAFSTFGDLLFYPEFSMGVLL
jgi:hypothetical protein